MCEGTSLAATQLATSLHANRPGRTRTCSPRFWSPLLATPALHRLLIFNDLALGQQRRRRWTPPALTLFLALFHAADRHPASLARRRGPIRAASGCCKRERKHAHDRRTVPAHAASQAIVPMALCAHGPLV